MSVNLNQFQEQVSELLLRHRSLLDVLSKFQQSNSSVNRAVVKSVTECGCIELYARKQPYSDSISSEHLLPLLESHVKGELCENCNDIVRTELGKHLFYMSALCNLLQIELDDVVDSESKKCSTLGFFNLS